MKLFAPPPPAPQLLRPEKPAVPHPRPPDGCGWNPYGRGGSDTPLPCPF